MGLIVGSLLSAAPRRMNPKLEGRRLLLTIGDFAAVSPWEGHQWSHR